MFAVELTESVFSLKSLGLCPKCGYAVGGWGSRVLNKNMEFQLKIIFFKLKSSK